MGLDVALGHSRRVFFFFFFVANVAFTRVFCRESRDYVLFGVEFWHKFLEIIRILAEILRKKLATGASAVYNQFGASTTAYGIICPIYGIGAVLP